MTNHIDQFSAVLSALRKYRVEYVLVGGVAVILYGLERVTADLDIFVRMTPDNIDRLKEALDDVFRDPSIQEITLEELSAYPVIRYGTPDGFYIDIMTRIGEAAEYEDLKWEEFEYLGTPIRIAVPETLFELKRDTVRPKDKVDAAFLSELIRRRGPDGREPGEEE
jgi:hypothetical protein